MNAVGIALIIEVVSKARWLWLVFAEPYFLGLSSSSTVKLWTSLFIVNKALLQGAIVNGSSNCIHEEFSRVPEAKEQQYLV